MTPQISLIWRIHFCDYLNLPMVPNKWSVTKIVLMHLTLPWKKTGKRKRKKREKSKPECTRALTMASQCLAPGRGQVVYSTQWGHDCHCQGPVPGQEWGWAGLSTDTAGESGSHALQKGSWGGGIHIPGQCQQAFLEVTEQGQYSWTTQRFRKRSRTKGQVTKGQSKSHWVSALRTESGARMASESEPHGQVLLSYSYSPSYFPCPLPSHNEGLRKSKAKDVDLELGDLAGVPIFLSLYVRGWTSLGFYKMGMPILPTSWHHCKAQIRSREGDNKL